MPVCLQLGGTNYAVAVLGAKGKFRLEIVPTSWRTAFQVTDATEDADRLIEGLASQIAPILKACEARGEPAELLGVACKGPLKYDANGDAILGPGRKIATLPFRDYPLTARLREALGRILGAPLRIPIRVLHDGAAAVLGEVSARGTLAGQRDGVAWIWGTGIGAGIVEDGRVWEGVGIDAAGDDFERNIGSPGRHLVQVVDLRAPRGYRIEYRGVPRGQTQPPLSTGETHLSERLAGPWLAKRLARLLDEQRLAGTTARMNVDERQISACIGGQSPSPEEAILKGLAEEAILKGLTAAAVAHDPWAIAQLCQIGEELGTALAAFIYQFRHRAFIRQVVLVSTLSERLGIDSSTAQGEDLLLPIVRRSIAEGLQSTELAPEAAVFAAGVRRSHLNSGREYLAFLDAQPLGA